MINSAIGETITLKYNDTRLVQLAACVGGEDANKLHIRFSAHSDALTYSNWSQIYPDYSSKLFQDTGYICFTNGLIIMWTYWGSHMLEETIFSRNTTNITIYEKEGNISVPLNYNGAWNTAFITFSDSNGIHIHVGYPGGYDFDTNKQKIFIDTLDESMFDNINLNGKIWSLTCS